MKLETIALRNFKCFQELNYTQNVKLQPILNRRYAERVVQFVEEWLCGTYQPC